MLVKVFPNYANISFGAFASFMSSPMLVAPALSQKEVQAIYKQVRCSTVFHGAPAASSWPVKDRPPSALLQIVKEEADDDDDLDDKNVLIRVLLRRGIFARWALQLTISQHT
jgi:hypothetical protein